jgi:Tfp pilus assembly protein PilO
MNVLNPILGGSIALLAAFAVIPAAYAAYPKTMKVSVEVWNDKEQDIHMTYASWEPKGASLSSYFIPPKTVGGRLT